MKSARDIRGSGAGFTNFRVRAGGTEVLVDTIVPLLSPPHTQPEAQWVQYLSYPLNYLTPITLPW